MNFRSIMFAVTTLTPVVLLFLGALNGGIWIIAAALYLTGFAFLLDRLLTKDSGAQGDAASTDLSNMLSVALGVLHFPLLILAIWAVSSADSLAIWEKALAFLAFGLFFGQVSNSNAHELIHRSDERFSLLGTWVFTSLLFGHHTSAHRSIHHRYVATSGDPNSAQQGESFYRFAPRAWWGSFWKGYDWENQVWKKGTKAWWQHPYVTYVGGAVLFCLLVLIVGGQLALLTYVAFAVYATAQLLLSDYVQHYGLRRKTLADGKIEPVEDKHSWNAPHRFTDLLMMAAPRHSDHHAHPSKAYNTLNLGAAADVPTLPYSLPIMGFIALIPRRWRKVMDLRVTQWMDPEAHAQAVAAQAAAQAKVDAAKVATRNDEVDQTIENVKKKAAEPTAVKAEQRPAAVTKPVPKPVETPKAKIPLVAPLPTPTETPAPDEAVQLVAPEPQKAEPQPDAEDSDLLAAIRKATSEVEK